MPMNYLVAPFQQSGSANVPITESTGAQTQGEGALGNLGIIQNSSYSGTPQAFANVVTDNVVLSGNITVNNQTILTTAFQSGTSTAGIVITGTLNQSGFGPAQGASIFASGNSTVSIVSTNSGAYAPAGYFLINVPTSGSPWVKVPFFNS